MAQARTNAPTFADALWPAAGASRLGRDLLLAIAGSLLLTLSAKIQVPFYPVPMTLQTGVVLLLGMTLGARLGAIAVLLYLAEGAAGLPVFSGTPERGIGIAYMVGPTGGYLAGFALAAFLAGWIAERRSDLPGLAVAALAGTLAIYVCGLAWLMLFVGALRAFELGLLPFVIGDLVKAALAVALAWSGTSWVRRRLDA